MIYVSFNGFRTSANANANANAVIIWNKGNNGNREVKHDVKS